MNASVTLLVTTAMKMQPVLTKSEASHAHVMMVSKEMAERLALTLMNAWIPTCIIASTVINVKTQ